MRHEEEQKETIKFIQFKVNKSLPSIHQFSRSFHNYCNLWFLIIHTITEFQNPNPNSIRVFPSVVHVCLITFTDLAFWEPTIPLNFREKKMHVKAAQSSSRDRTHEFHSITERLKKSGSGPAGPSSSSSSRSEEQRSSIANQSDFNRRASKIGFGIHQTSQKLSKLAKCKQMTINLFNWI